MKWDEMGKSGKRYVRTSPPIWEEEVTETKMSYAPVIKPMTCASIFREGDPIPVIEMEKIELFELADSTQSLERELRVRDKVCRKLLGNIIGYTI